MFWQELYRKLRGILNKLTPQKFETLNQQVLDLKIDTEERLKGVIDIIFEKVSYRLPITFYFCELTSVLYGIHD